MLLFLEWGAVVLVGGDGVGFAFYIFIDVYVCLHLFTNSRRLV